MGTELITIEKLNADHLKTKLYSNNPTPDSVSFNDTLETTNNTTTENTNKNETTNSHLPSHANWLGDCCIALSSEGTIAAMSKGATLVVTSKRGGSWIVDTIDTQLNTGDRITSLCFVYLGKAHLQHCLCVGFQNGHLRIYHINGTQLVAQRFHSTPIIRLTPQFSGDEQHRVLEGLVALYGSNIVVVITGLSFVSAVLLAQAHSADATPYSLPATLSYRKWSLFGAETVTDAVHVPPPSTHLDTFGAGKVVSVGRNPIISFYSITEEQDSTISVAVALASTVASKLTSAVFSLAKSWWRSTPTVDENAETKPVEAPLPAAVSLSVRKCLNDSQRQLYSVLAAPGERQDLAVATDGFGRVLLVDVQDGLIVRMWKGYRDAQCGWILDKHVLYLVLHAPRRGLVEIWRMRHGARVGVHSIGPGWRLLPSENTCYLLSPTGGLYKVHVK